MKKLLLVLTILLAVNSFGQSNLWKKLDGKDVTTLTKLPRDSNPTKFDLYKIDLAQLKSRLALAPSRFSGQISNVIIAFPNSDGEMQNFRVYESSVMHPDLAARQPEIQGYIGECLDDKTASIHFSTTIFGLHTFTLAADKSADYIDPYSKDLNHYMVYSKTNLTTNKTFECGFDDNAPRISQNMELENDIAQRSENGLFKTYRLALACTIEYAAFHVNAAGLNSGTLAQKKAAVLAAQNVTMVRINGLYEKDFAIKLVIVPNNTNIIFITSDSYTNADGVALLGENQTVCDTVIGDANYDIGHVCSTGGGGIASLQSPCATGSKARGVTGSPSPVGDPYDIDYVAHEMGHQFGCQHTFNNSCGGNVSATSSFETGSGSTIMGYAGICPPDVQSNSDAYFHTRSIIQAQAFINAGGNCGVILVNNNAAPVITALSNYTIPKGTPFVLEGVATDADGDALTYCWEQYNANSSTQPPVATSTVGPNYRSLLPSLDSKRYFPKLSTVITNSLATTWEVTPTVARAMSFRLMVRDNELINGGQTKVSNISTVTVNATAGPFVVTSQNTQETWAPGASETITWNVAGTDVNGINTTTVTVYLSTDGGLTFPTVLITNTPNDGSEAIVVPNLLSQTCRLMVKADNNVYYAVNTTNFLIGYVSSNVCTTYNYTGAAFAIPNGTSSITKTIAVPTSNSVTDVNVSINATHTNLQNLVIAMTRPASGTQFQLFNQQCTGSANMNVTFDQQGSVLTCASPTSGTYIPSGTANLNLLNVNIPAGNFSLNFRDVVTGADSGTVNAMSVTICNNTFLPINLANESFDFNDFALFPNPNSGSFNIRFSSNASSKVAINIVDLSGRKIFEKAYTNSGLFDENIQLDKAQAGIYLVSITDGDKKIVKRIVVE